VHHAKADTGEYAALQTAPKMFTTKIIIMSRPPDQRRKNTTVLTAPKERFFYILDAKTANSFPPSRSVKTTAFLRSANRQTSLSPLQGGQTVTSTTRGDEYIPSPACLHPTQTATQDTTASEAAAETVNFSQTIAWDPIAETARWSVEGESPQPASSPPPAISVFQDKHRDSAYAATPQKNSVRPNQFPIIPSPSLHRQWQPVRA